MQTPTVKITIEPMTAEDIAEWEQFVDENFGHVVDLGPFVVHQDSATWDDVEWVDDEDGQIVIYPLT